MATKAASLCSPPSVLNRPSRNQTGPSVEKVVNSPECRQNSFRRSFTGMGKNLCQKQHMSAVRDSQYQSRSPPMATKTEFHCSPPSLLHADESSTLLRVCLEQEARTSRLTSAPHAANRVEKQARGGDRASTHQLTLIRNSKPPRRQERQDWNDNHAQRTPDSEGPKRCAGGSLARGRNPGLRGGLGVLARSPWGRVSCR
jgi:hypothetical protein